MSSTSESNAESHTFCHLEAAESELNSLHQEALHSQRLVTLGTLAAGVAHEINNILTPVLGYAQLVQSHPEDAELQQKAAQRSITAVENVVRISQALLGFARLEDEEESTSISQALQASTDCLGRDHTRDNVRFKVDIPSEARVRMTPIALQQVFLNLILNAQKAMGKLESSAHKDMRGVGGVIRISALEKQDGTTVIKVSDTGPGIPQDILDHLFSPFVSSDPSEDRSSQAPHSGTGLGLAVCRQLITDADGNIEVNSSPGQGAEFIITLPTDRSYQSKAG